jgi:hypothetical protein
MRTSFGGGGGSAAPKSRQKPKKSSGDKIGTVLADLIKNVGTTVQKSANEATAKQMPKVAKQRGFHVVGNQAYFSNASGQVQPVLGKKLSELLAAANPSGGKYGARVYRNNVRLGGADVLASLQSAIDQINHGNKAFKAQQDKLVVRTGPNNRPVMPMVWGMQPGGVQGLGPVVNTPEYDAYKPGEIVYKSGGF